MKQGLIESRVNAPNNITLRIKQYIQQQSNKNETPFASPQVPVSVNKAKRSLTDWRHLYQKHQKIMPNQESITSISRPFTTGQCFRRKIRSSHHNSQFPTRPFMTRQTKRAKFLETTKEKLKDQKRQSMLEFAVAQDVYQHQVLKDESNSSRDKKLSAWKLYNERRRNYLKVGEELQAERPKDAEEINLTDYYIQRVSNDFKHRIVQCNRVKIRETSKINNSRFMDNLQLLRRQAYESEHGLRYYNRA